MIRVWTVVAVMMCSLSCTLVEIEPPAHEVVDENSVSVEFCAEPSSATKSSISPDESRIRDLNVYAFRDGVLADEAYVSEENVAALCLAKGYSYNIYAVANMGEKSAPVDERRFLEEFSYSVESLSEISYAMPMFCHYGRLHVAGGSPLIQLNMQRLVSKMSLTIDKDALLEGLQVRSVRICQSATVVRPFKWYGNGGSRAESPSEIIDGDFATDEDLQQLNAGGQVQFYALENCQGILLPENESPDYKVPENLGDKDSMCTYLEICCCFGEEGLLDGGVDYRIYLGLDATSSFDVPGNSCINVELNLTDDGLHEVSWKVNADVSIRDGYAYGYVSEGMHPVNELYVGEMLLYEVELSDEMLEYLRGDVSGCYIGFLQNGHKSCNILVDNIFAEDNLLQAELLCREPAEGMELYLYSRQGECLGCLEDDVVVNLPGIAFSEYDSWLDYDPVEALTYVPECEVNGNPAEFYLYMVDEDGCNLNGASAYLYDTSLLEFNCTGAVSGSSSVSSIFAAYEMLDDAPGRAAAKVSVFCENDGDDHAHNVLLAGIYNSANVISVETVDECYEISKAVSVGLSIPEISLTLVDNGWAGYHESQLSVIVDNPSNLPVEVNAWQLIATDNNTGAVDKEYVEQNLTRTRMEYMTGAFYNGAPVLYGSSVSFVSERNSFGSAALEEGEFLVYPLTGIATDDIIRAIKYDKLGNNQMMHMFDVTINSQKMKAEDVVFHDAVSDGSSTYDYMYYHDDSWNYKGASLFSGGDLISYSGRWAYDYPYVSAQSLTRMYNRHLIGMPVCVTMDFDPSYDAVAISTLAGKGAQYGLSVSIRYDGIVNGYVRTYPKGTWGSAKDNYCSVDIGYETVGVPLKANTPEVWADEGKIKSSVGEIYEFSYKDSPKPLGSDAYMHRAHPIDLNLDVCFCVEGTQKTELYPVSVDWNFESIPFYHVQDDKDYNCVLDADYKGFELVVIKHK